MLASSDLYNLPLKSLVNFGKTKASKVCSVTSSSISSVIVTCLGPSVRSSSTLTNLTLSYSVMFPASLAMKVMFYQFKDDSNMHSDSDVNVARSYTCTL